MFDKWAIACRLRFPPTAKCSYVCSRHFNEYDFGKKKLKKNVIPSRNLSIDESIQIDEPKDHIPVLFSGKTYSKPESTELTFQELSVLEPMEIVSSDGERNMPEARCNFCLKAEQSVQFYRSKYTHILKKYQKLKRRANSVSISKKANKFKLKTKKAQIMNLRRESKKPLSDLIDALPDVGNYAKLFSKMILCKKPISKRFDQNQKNLALDIHYKSPSLYRYFKIILDFNLPSVRSLYRWQLIQNTRPGFNANITENLMKIASKWDKQMREASLIFDEICIRRELTYDITSDEIIGFTDTGDNKTTEPAKYVCLFMIRALFGTWKFIISYYATNKPITGELLESKIKENINYCKTIGFHVRSVTCDQGSNNRNCFNRLNISPEKPYFYHGHDKIFAIYDCPHLMKSIRNTLLKKDIQCNDGVVTWKCVENLYALEKNNATKMCPKLTSKHVRPNSWEKMKVSYAVQVMSHTCSAAIKTANELELFSKDVSLNALSTSVFFSKINSLFDCLNTKEPFNRNTYQCALRRDNAVRSYLEEIIPYLNAISFKGDNQTYWLKGLIQTVTATLQLTEELFDEFPNIEFFLTYKLNQDTIENLFSLIRSKGGFNKNPSLHNFNHIVAKIMSHKVLPSQSGGGNCQEDGEEFLFIEEIIKKNSDENVDTELSVEEYFADNSGRKCPILFF